MTPDEFREQLRKSPPENIVEQIILTDEPGPYTSHEALAELRMKIRAKFDLKEDQPLSTVVVGSAKLGFAILDKPGREGRPYKPAYRAYQPGQSDIDVAVISPPLYGKIWQALALYGTNQHIFPWRTDLSPYMLHGWIRPDKFPSSGPQRCTDWKDLICEVSRSPHFRYKKLRCGIFHSRYFLSIYQQRGVIAAKTAESVV